MSDHCSSKRLGIAGFTLFMGSCLAAGGYLYSTSISKECSTVGDPDNDTLCAAQSFVSVVFYLSAACCLGLNCFSQDLKSSEAENSAETSTENSAYNLI